MGEKGTPEKGPKTPVDEDEIISEEELDNTMDTTVKQKNKNSKYELKAIDIANIEKGINIIRNKLMQEKEKGQEANKYDSMEVEDNTSLAENSEVWEPTPNGHEALEDTLDSTLEQGARSCVAQRTRSHKEVIREKMDADRSINISKLNKIFRELKNEEDRSRLERSLE